jgi:hypothetical protein
MPARSPESPVRTYHSDGERVEAVPKQEGSYELLSNNRVRIYARGEFVLDHEDAKNLYIVIYAPPATIDPTFPVRPPPILSATPVRVATGALRLTDIGHGLPHRGQWREHFAVGDILGDGSTQIVSGPARKSGGAPVVFREQAGDWQRIALHVPAGHYDYGGVAIADFDGDGRNDLVLAMHLTGFSVLRATATGDFERIDTGLPHRGDAALSGSGHAALALPTPPHEPAPLLLLQEPGVSAPNAQRAPALANFHYTRQGFVNEAIAANPFPGNDLTFVPASAKCKAKLAVGSAVAGAPTVLQTADEKTWTTRAVESFPDPQAIVSAVALGDVDGDGCTDFAVAYSSRVDNTWHSVVDIYLDRNTTWKRINLLDAARDDRVTAMTVGENSGNPLLLTLDNVGTVRGYRVAGESAELVIDVPAPQWRKGCSGSDIRALPGDASGHLRIAASFAGEPTMGHFDRCREGGGIEAWRIE